MTDFKKWTASLENGILGLLAQGVAQTQKHEGRAQRIRALEDDLAKSELQTKTLRRLLSMEQDLLREFKYP